MVFITKAKDFSFRVKAKDLVFITKANDFHAVYNDTSRPRTNIPDGSQ